MADGREMIGEMRTMRGQKTGEVNGFAASRRYLGALVSVLALGLLSSALATPAQAVEPITLFEVSTSTTQAGGHPDLDALFALESPGEPEAAESVSANLPKGVFGNPNATPQCSSVDFALYECPITSQVGLVTVRGRSEGNPNFIFGTAPVFVLQPQSVDDTARFGFVLPTLNTPIEVPITVRSAGDYGLRMTVAGISQETPLSFADFFIWGFPAANSHAKERFAKGEPGAPAGCPGLSEPDESCILTPHQTGISVHPLIDNPSICTGEVLPVSLDVRTYQDPSHTSHAEATYPPTTGCEQQTFNPVLNMQLTSTETDAPAGLDLQLKSNQFLSEATSPSQIRSATLTLPEGVSINPDAADGQTACRDEEANFGSEAASSCPDSSKIGTFNIETPALAGPLTGSLYFGEPTPGDQYRVFMIAEGFGIHAKFVASVRPDPVSGQLTVSVTDLPEVPFESFNMHLFSSQRGLVATPTQCRVYGADSVFVPWNDKLAEQHSRPNVSFNSGPNGSPCPGQTRPFSPSLVAGTSSPVAGAFSSFTLRLDREDGDQFLGDLNFRMPPGFTGSLRGIAYCPEGAIAQAAETPGRAEQSASSCPSNSQVGTTNVAAGPGSHPFHAVGRMYLAGPFNGAPLSVVAITPALAGPYDYGTVVVRIALHVDPTTAQVSAVSDKVPSIIGGVPIRMRSIQVNIDRPDFTINPTNCSPFSVDSQGIGDQGTVADFSSYFHVVNCANLGFKPRMAIAVVGGHKATTRSQNPGLVFDLRTRAGDANIKSLSVTLPKAFAIDQSHLRNICSKAKLQAEHCASSQAIGIASTKTPLLDQPLSGKAYAVSGFGKLPHVVFILAGQVTLMPEAESASVDGGSLKTTVNTVPDAPIGEFRLKLFGGSKGYIVNTRSLCHAPVIAQVMYTGQNGDHRAQRVTTKTACGSNAKGSHAEHR